MVEFVFGYYFLDKILITELRGLFPNEGHECADFGWWDFAEGPGATLSEHHFWCVRGSHNLKNWGFWVFMFIALQDKPLVHCSKDGLIETWANAM